MTGKQNSIQEMLALIKNDEKNRIYFFSKATDKKWYEPLKADGFFDATTMPRPIKTEKGFVLSFWPQQGYLERLSIQIQNKTITDLQFINSFLETLRKIESISENVFLGRVLFLIVMRIPLSYLKNEDIERAFLWLLEGDVRDSLLETTVHEGLDLILSQVMDEPHGRGLFKEFTKHFLTISKTEKYRGHDPKLVFFSDWGYKQFRGKHFNVGKLAVDKPFILIDVVDVAEAILINILSSFDLDKSTQWWRPAVEEHYQNSFHDSAQSIILGIIGMCVSALIGKGHAISQIDDWRTSRFKTFNRLYIFIASQSSNNTMREHAAAKILEINFAYECMHEIYHFLSKQFESLSAETQEQILDFIENIISELSEEEELKKRQTAWKKLRWLEAISNSSNTRVQKMRADAMALTENKLPEHPDFGSYMGRTFVGPTSPRDARWLEEASLSDILNELTTFKNTDDFASPSIDGFARALETWVISDPMKASALLKELGKLNPQYISALLDGYVKCWAEKKYVPLSDLFESIKELVTTAEFMQKVVDEKTNMSWVVSSICRFIEAGTRIDENAFDPNLNNDCYLILKSCLEVIVADKRFEGSSDAHSRAINEPRGQVLEALIILTLRRARLAKNDSTEFSKAWNDLVALIEPILKSQNEIETSLHAHLGAYYRQFQFLGEGWLMKNIDLIVPSPSQKPLLWRAFMDGFSYVTDYSKEMYLLLKNKGYLLKYLRLDVDSNKKSSRRNQLRTRVLELALVAYVLSDESMDEGIIATILKEKIAEEWHQLI